MDVKSKLADTHLTPPRSTILQAHSLTIETSDELRVTPCENSRSELHTSRDFNRDHSLGPVFEESHESVLDEIDDVFQGWSTNDLVILTVVGVRRMTSWSECGRHRYSQDQVVIVQRRPVLRRT